MRKYRVFGIVMATGLLADQASKIAVRHNLELGRPHSVVPGFFDLIYSENTGAAFSLFRDLWFGSYLLGAVGILALVLIASYVRKLPADGIVGPILFGLVAAGAVGNLIDRIAFGRVTDFLLAHWHQHYWPVFNVADTTLVLGVIGLLFSRAKWEKAS
jgi:signal peptidase II